MATTQTTSSNMDEEKQVSVSMRIRSPYKEEEKEVKEVLVGLLALAKASLKEATHAMKVQHIIWERKTRKKFEWPKEDHALWVELSRREEDASKRVRLMEHLVKATLELENYGSKSRGISDT